MEAGVLAGGQWVENDIISTDNGIRACHRVKQAGHVRPLGVVKFLCYLSFGPAQMQRAGCCAGLIAL